MPDTFNWTDETVQMLTERYKLDGPRKLSEVLGTTKTSVVMKARRLGLLTRSNNPATVWTEEMLQLLHSRYTTEGHALHKELGIAKHVLMGKVKKLGLRCSKERYQRGATSRTKNNTAIDYNYFDQWTHDSAYVFGFLLADGSISKTSMSAVVIGLAEKDICVLEFIREQMKCNAKFYFRNNAERIHKDGCTRQNAVYLHLRSKILVQKLISLGMKPRKTYNDDTPPEIPEKYVADFIRGYLDGDGTIFISGTGRCNVGFVGSVNLIRWIMESLVKYAGMSTKTVKIEHHKNADTGRIGWTAPADLKKFHDYVYYKGHGFCLERKKSVLVNHLKTKTESPIPEQE